MFLRKYKEKQFFFVGISVRRIVWVTAKCSFMGDIYIYIYIYRERERERERERRREREHVMYRKKHVELYIGYIYTYIY